MTSARYQIVERPDGFFNLQNVGRGTVIHNRTLKNLMKYCENYAPEVPYEVVWWEAPSPEEVAFKVALESIHGHPLDSTHKTIWDAGVEFGKYS